MGIAMARDSIVKNTGPDVDKILRTLRTFGPRCVFHAIADTHFTGSRTAFHDEADTVSR